MAKRLQLRRGTTAQTNAFTGALGEVTVDTDKDVVVVHDNATVGGHPVAARANTDGTISFIAKDGTVRATINTANKVSASRFASDKTTSTPTDVTYSGGGTTNNGVDVINSQVDIVANGVVRQRYSGVTGVRTSTIDTAAALYPDFSARAWVNFNGTTTPPSVRGSGNVSSVVRNSTGDFTITLATSLPDANYSVALATGQNDEAFSVRVKTGATLTASGLTVQTYTFNGTLANPTHLSVTITR